MDHSLDERVRNRLTLFSKRNVRDHRNWRASRGEYLTGS